jgi:hypothetical protein
MIDSSMKRCFLVRPQARFKKLQSIKTNILLALTLVTLVACDSEHEHEHEHEVVYGVDHSLFMDGAVVTSSIEDCVLSDGTKSTCYSITVAGYPVNHNVGPFCPQTTSSTAAEAGLWFDGDAVYDVDGTFILGLANLYDDENWKLYNDDGTVRITDTPEAFNAAARPDVDPEYQNYCVEGRMEWLENSAPITSTVLIPTSPVVSKEVIPARGNLGITLNGVIVAASAPVDAILSAYTIAAFDDCGGHINPFEGYHLHGARGCSEVGDTEEGETPIFAYALDGFPIHSPLPGGSNADGLDQCQGHKTDTMPYHYHAANAEENGVLKCFSGLTVKVSDEHSRPPGGPRAGPPPNGPQGGRTPKGEHR